MFIIFLNLFIFFSLSFWRLHLILLHVIPTYVYLYWYSILQLDRFHCMPPACHVASYRLPPKEIIINSTNLMPQIVVECMNAKLFAQATLKYIYVCILRNSLMYTFNAIIRLLANLKAIMHASGYNECYCGPITYKYVQISHIH